MSHRIFKSLDSQTSLDTIGELSSPVFGFS